MQRELKKQIGKSANFNLFLKKLKTSVNHHLRKRKKIKIGRKGNKIIRAAEWVDLEVVESIKLRMRLNKIWKQDTTSQKTPRPTTIRLYVPPCFWFWFTGGTCCPLDDNTSHSVFCCGLPVGRFVLWVTRRPIIVHFFRWKPLIICKN